MLVKGIKCVHFPEKDVMIELDEVKNARHSIDMHTLKIHMAKRVFTKKQVSISKVVSNSKL